MLELLEFFKNVEEKPSSDKFWQILFLVQKALTTVLAQAVTNITSYSKTPQLLMKNAVGDNSVESWLNSAESSSIFPKIFREVIASRPWLLKVTRGVVDSQALNDPVVRLVKTEVES